MTQSCWPKVRELQKVVDEFKRSCKRRKLRVNVEMNEVIVLKRKYAELVNFATTYRVCR